MTWSQRISDLNGCDLLNQISFKLIALNRSANSLFTPVVRYIRLKIQKLLLKELNFERYDLLN